MSRLSTTNGVYGSQSRARQAARAARMNAQRQSSRDRYDARKAAQADFQRALMLQAQDANLSQQQAIMDANLRAQAAAGQMYAQQQYADDAQRSRMANDTTLRQRNRLDGIFDKRQQMDLAWNQNQIATQQAALQHALDARMRRLDHASQMARDKQQHAYGQEDARLQNTFNRDLTALQHQNNLGMAEAQQGYDQANARLGSQLQADRDRQLHGYGQEDLRLQQQFTKDNYIQKLNDQRVAQGWTRSPALENEYQELQNAKIKAWKMYRRGELEKDDLNEQLRLISDSEMDLLPDTPPAQPTLEKAKGKIWEQGGAMWTMDEKGNAVVALPPPKPAREGSGQGKMGRYDKDTGRLNPAEASSVYAEMRKAYQQYIQAASQPNADGTPSQQKVKTWEEFVRSEAMQYPPDERAVFAEFMGGPKQSSIDKIKNNREIASESGYSQLEAMPPSEAPDWQRKGADILNQNVARIQAIAELGQKQLVNLPNDPLVTGAMAINPEKAAPIIAELKRAMQRFEIIARTGSDPDVKDPGLLDYQKSLRDQLRQITGSQTNVNLPASGAAGMLNTDAQWANPTVPNYEF